MKPVIEVNQVWKEYNKGIDRRYKSLRDTFVNLPKNIWGERKEKFWALQDINFQVEAGESIGIIGRNGAGKSTLLKILSRITLPTKGSITLRGRVASLLEVGTGFHPELTGRENIYFNGSILGMKNAEIKRKFDEIVDFSGVESFIDTPLKHYSSGMQMRLAFSVAAHLDAEILLIDEVLAVGDAEFQKKCIGKMDEVSKGEGKTVVFVSHDMGMVEKLCDSGIYLVRGQISLKGNVYNVIEYYQSNNKANMNFIVPDSKLEHDIEIIEADVKSLNQNKVTTFSDMTVEVKLKSKIKSINQKCKIDIGINNEFGKRVAWMSTFDFLYNNEESIQFKIENLPLRAGLYDCNVYFESGGNVINWYKNILPFHVNNASFLINTPKNQSDIELKYEILKK